MVAETQISPSASAPKKPIFHPGFRIPEAIRLTIRSLYVIQGLGPSAIAPMVNLTQRQVTNLIAREKWSATRSATESGRKAKAIAQQDARATRDVERVVEASAILSEEMQLRSLNLCGEYLDAKDAKSLQMASGAARNFVQISTMLRNPAQRGAIPGQSGGNGGATLIFVGALERTTPKELKPAEPAQAAIEVSSSPVNT